MGATFQNDVHQEVRRGSELEEAESGRPSPMPPPQKKNASHVLECEKAYANLVRDATSISEFFVFDFSLLLPLLKSLCCLPYFKSCDNYLKLNLSKNFIS